MLSRDITMVVQIKLNWPVNEENCPEWYGITLDALSPAAVAAIDGLPDAVSQAIHEGEWEPEVISILVGELHE